MRGIVDRVRALGAELVVVGNGSPEQAARFQHDEKIDFPLFTDPQRRSYRAAGLRRSLASALRPGLLGNALRAYKKGFRQKGIQGDAFQLGGVFVITPRSEVVFSQVSREAGDHADPEEIVAALEGLG